MKMDSIFLNIKVNNSVIKAFFCKMFICLINHFFNFHYKITSEKGLNTQKVKMLLYSNSIFITPNCKFSNTTNQFHKYYTQNRIHSFLFSLSYTNQVKSIFSTLPFPYFSKIHFPQQYI